MAPAADIAVDETKRLVGNGAGLELLDTLESMKRRVDFLEQSAKQSGEMHIRTMMALRKPVYKAPGGTLTFYDLSPMTLLSFIYVWAGGFEKIYGLPYSYGKLISPGSKIVALADARADLKLLVAFKDCRQTCLPKRDAIIRLWKAAIDTKQDPEGVFRTPAVTELYDRIMRSFSSAQ
ncbi:hypothetical protein TESG_02794 [Trichophyton tonsurans CBS 112818]|uniref:Uncharacterized protein n=2 Tax=Trichophyton TaxID=5550 RepID=F2PND5_TRIEC|nr:hypothetical protein TESG_02794 [Trichophyton tonsurans CBS 112818]EGE03403.1 hypothetical protein TEQG_02439 [Trichophyton equinum CBS 127.97]